MAASPGAAARQYLVGSITTQLPMPARLDFTTPLVLVPGPRVLKSHIGVALEKGEDGEGKLVARVRIGRRPNDERPDPETTSTWSLAQELPLPCDIRQDLDWKIHDYRVVDALEGLPPPLPMRGRPKKALPPNGTSGTSPVIKRPRGRPRKNPPAVEPAPPPAAGRKRARPAEKEEEEKIESSSSSSSSSSDGANGAESSSSSRSSHSGDSEASPDPEGAPPAKRRRRDADALQKEGEEEAAPEKDSE